MSDEEESIEESYVVEAIRGWRYNLKEERKEYLIKWQGYPEEDNGWEPEEHLECPERFEQFVKSLKGADEKCFHSKNLDKLNGFERHAEYVKWIGSDGPHDSDAENTDKPSKEPFYVLAKFEDSDLAEEITMKQLFDHDPDQALDFCESRLLRKKMKSSTED